MNKEKKIPLRKCVGCDEMKPKKELIRVLKTEEGMILDETGRKNGRGAYLCRSTACFQRARKNRGIERSLKMSVPEEVYQELAQQLASVVKED